MYDKISIPLTIALLSHAVAAATEDEIIVTATRADKQLTSIPAAVSVVEKKAIQVGRQQLGLDESLTRVPGLFFQNRYNFAQDLRVSIRGFGARANFGIRGVKIFVDDIPSTLADGQSGVDDIDIGSLQRIEVVRGPSSSLYGGASGGVIRLYTESGPETVFVETAITRGAFDQQKYQFKTGGQYHRLNYLVNMSYLDMAGYRDHANVEHGVVNGKFNYDVDRDSDFTLMFNLVDSPTADDPGAIRKEDIAIDPRQAQARNLSSNAGEALEQQKVGWVYKTVLGEKHELVVRNYYTWRDFGNFLPIGTHIPFVANDGVVQLDRFFYGGGLQYIYTDTLFGQPNRLLLGVDIDRQKDDRRRFLNNAGVKGALSFDQREQADALGFYFRNELAITDKLEISLGGRYDTLELSVDDHFIDNADQSSELDFNEFSPTLGVSWNPIEGLHFYASYATAFATPTFTELANPARNLNVNLGGFNNVDAQTADSAEIGVKGTLKGTLKSTPIDSFYFDIAAFSMRVEDEITSVTNIGNRSFFDNANTDRDGIEALLIFEFRAGLTLTTAYTYSDFNFDDFSTDPALEGNHLPGIPTHQFYAELAYEHASGLYVVWDMLAVDDFFANNANTVENNAYEVATLRVGHQYDLGKLRISPYLGINNLFDEQYNANVRINAFGERFFEPAPDRHIYGGVTLRYAF